MIALYHKSKLILSIRRSICLKRPKNMRLSRVEEYLNPTVHQNIIETLGKKKAGMTREEIIERSGLINSGDLTVKLEELEVVALLESTILMV